MRRLLGALALAVTVLAAVPAVLPAPTSAAAPTAVGTPPERAAADGYRETRTLTRTFTDASGEQRTVASYDVTVSADTTRDLRGRQRVRISWSGAQPSGGRAANPYGENGLNQEYPVVIMQCRGQGEDVRPETCWTSSFSQRSQLLRSDLESVWREDAAADEADKARVSGLDPIPTEQCPTADTNGFSSRLTEFVAANGTVYPACNADTMPPEAAVGAAFPPAEVAAFTDEDGAGSVQFEVRSDVENESLGCNNTVDCSIVVIPIVGISCDRQEGDSASLSERACRRRGQFAPGSSNFANDGIDTAVGPALWWSESNWRHRFEIPISFGLPPDTCDVLDPRPPTGFFGSELLAQAGLQWAPAYCLNKKRFKFQLNITSDAAGFNLMESDQAAAAVVSSEQEQRGEIPVGYAPTAVTGFAIGYIIDRPDNAGEYDSLKLNARLIAKLLTQSYPASDLGRGHPGMADNPISIVNDPEFIRLNPGLSRIDQEAAATVLSLSVSSDVIEQLTAYLAADPEARAFIAGQKDPWGMRVNPAYRDLAVPLDEFPLLDTYVPETQDSCRQANPVVYLSAVAAPVTSLRKISDALLDGQPNVQTRCEFDPPTGTFKIGKIARQSYGARFMLGLVSLGDAARFGLRTAALETRPNRFVAPTPQTMANAVGLMTRSTPRGPFELDQADLRRSSNAYPGTMVVYTASKLFGVDPDTARSVSQFIRVSTTEGQRPGSGNGRLPGGFVPIRNGGPTAKLKKAATEVAALVSAQDTRPPRQGGGDDDGTDDGTDGTGDSDTDTGTTDSGGTDVPGDTDLPAVDAPTDGAVPTETPAPTTDAPAEIDVVSTASTRGAEAGIAGWLLPALLLLGLVAGGAVVLVRFLVAPLRAARTPGSGS